MGGRRVETWVSFLMAVVATFLWAVPARASGSRASALPMGGGLCGKRDKVYDKI
jgi:hypothetical protein